MSGTGPFVAANSSVVGAPKVSVEMIRRSRSSSGVVWGGTLPSGVVGSTRWPSHGGGSAAAVGADDDSPGGTTRSAVVDGSPTDGSRFNVEIVACSNELVAANGGGSPSVAWLQEAVTTTAMIITSDDLAVGGSPTRRIDIPNEDSESRTDGWTRHNGAMALNVLGTVLEPCSIDPMTGFYRDGCCNTGGGDVGVHVVCAAVTDEFLAFSAAAGNDLSTPIPAYGFPGLKAGDRWCLCASRWAEALEAGVAPQVVLASTHAAAVEYATLDDLKAHAVDAGEDSDAGDGEAGEESVDGGDDADEKGR